MAVATLAFRPAFAAEVPKLAVLPMAADFSVPADLLTAELSSRPGVTMVEREQIQKVLREQELAASQRQDFVKLGRMLNADGLLLLERRIEGTNEVMAARLLAVRPGIVAAEHRFVLPLAQPADWGKSYAPRIERLLPKLVVKPEDAVAISVLNLRSAVATAEAAALEQELTALLQFRLAREPSLFVLERRRLDELQAEKQLEGTESEPFWNSAHVLDGTINRDVVSSGAVTIHARLVPPRGVAVIIEVSGRRAALGRLVEEVTARMLAALNKSSKPEDWQPAAEAERFFQEAVWAWSWRLWNQAAEAADASWALGRHTQPVAAYRVASRAWAAFGMRGPLSYQSTGSYGFRPPPSPQALTLLARAMEIYSDAFQEFSNATNGPGTAWGSVGMDVLLVTSRLLDRFQESVEFCQGQEEALSRVRAMARQVNQLLTTNRFLGPTSWKRGHGSLPVLPIHFIRGDRIALLGEARLCEVWMDAAGTWFEKPADTVALYRKLLEPADYPEARAGLFGGPLLAAWSVRDRAELPSVRLQFLREMAQTTNEQVRLDGLRLILDHSIDPDELLSTARLYVNEAWRAYERIFTREIDGPVGGVLTNLARRVEPWGRPSVDSLFALAEDWSRRYTPKAQDLSYEVWNGVVARLTNKTFQLFGFLPPSPPPRMDQARELAVTFEALNAKWGDFRGMPYLLQLERSLGVTNLHTTPTRRVDLGPVTAEGLPILRITRSWSLSKLATSRGRELGTNPQARNLTWNQGRLFLETRTFDTSGIAHDARPALVCLNPDSMHAELIEAPYAEFPHPRAPRLALPLGDELFFCASGVLWRRDAKGGWHQLSVATEGWAVPFGWSNRVVLSGVHSIIEVEPQTGENRVLASSRRNPPVSALDRLGSPGNAPLAVWPGNQLCALVAGRIWKYDPAQKDWLAVWAATNCGESLELHSSGAFYRQSAECGPGLLGGWRTGSSKLEIYTCGTSAMRIGQYPEFTPPYWLHPENCAAEESAAAFVGSNLWIFPKKTAASAIQKLPSRPRSKSVVFCDPRFGRALELSLELAGIPKEKLAVLDSAVGNVSAQVEFLPTPEGLAILFREGGLVYWSPRFDVEEVLNEAASRGGQRERLEFAALRRFDRDGNGWLDDGERRAMMGDPAWRQEERRALETARAAALAEHEKEWTTLFAEADKDHDGKMSRQEFREFRAAYPEFLANRTRGVIGSITQSLLPYDLDGDEALTRSEFLAFAAEPRPLAQVNRSVDWISQFGFKPEQGDLNGDGTLDNAEWLQISRMIRERLSGAAKKEIRTP